MPILNKARIITLIILVITVFLAWMIIKNPKSTLSKKPQVLSYHVESKLIQYQDLQPTFKLIAKVSALDHTILKSSQSAKVEKILVKEGQMVSKNQVLMKLSEPELALHISQLQSEYTELGHNIDLHQATLKHLEQRYENQKNLLDIEKKAFERQQKLYQAKSIAKSTFDKASSTYTHAEMAHNQVRFEWQKQRKELLMIQSRQQALQARIQQQQTQLHELTIRAPYDGIVIDKQQSVGAEVQAQSPLLEIYNPQTLELEAFISQNNLIAFKKAQDARKLGAYIIEHDSKVQLPLAHLASHIDQEHHFIPISFRLSGHAHQYALGSYMPIYITLPALQGLAIDPKAYFHEGYVYTIVDHHLKAHKAQILAQTYNTKGQLELVIHAQGVKNGDRMLSSPLSQAREGLKVTYG